MASRPKSHVAPKGPRRDVLASLKLAHIEISKPILPAELMSTVLDYLDPIDLINVAKTSRRMYEMVYDDTRWVRLLKQMGYWDELEARKHAGSLQSNGQSSGLISQGWITTQSRIPAASVGVQAVNNTGGFDAVEFTGSNKSGQYSEAATTLKALSSVQSVRGKAREQYGKIHGALYPLYRNVVTSEETTDCLVFKIFDNPEEQAQLLAHLQSFSHVDRSRGWLERNKKLSLVISDFESAALREFIHGYDNGDIEGPMSRYARVLVALNGGHIAIQHFMQQNNIIRQKTDFGRPADCLKPGTVSLEHTQAFLTRLSVAINEEVSIMDRCFPNCAGLSTTFMGMIQQTVLSPYFNTLFDELHTQHSNSYLQAVSGTYVQTSNFVRCLNPAKNFPKEFHEAASKMVVDVFEKHVELYLVEELDAFRKHSEDVVSDWDRQLSEHAASTESFYMSNVNRQADKKDFLTSFKKVLMAPVNILPGFSKSSTAKGYSVDKPALSPGSVGASHPNRSSTIIVPVTTPPVSNEAPTTELAAKAAIMNAKLEGIRSLFSIEVALNLVHVAKLSLERAAQFVEMQGELGKAARQKCEAIFISLLQILGQQHVIAGFDKAVGHLSVYKPRQQRSEDDQQGVEPLVTFLELVNVGDLILQMMDVFYEQELIGARLIDNSDFLNPAVKEKKRFEQMLDERVAAGLNKGIDVLLEEVEFLLATKQTALDFYPESADGNIQAVDIGPSDAATSIVQIVSSHTQMLVGSTDKSTLDVFNQEVGLRLFGVLCKHLKRQRISIMGSIKLISDMNHYFTFIQTMKNDHLILYFTALREMSQLYLIDPSDSKEMATIIADVDRFKGILRAEEVYEFAERRADWYQVKRDVERAMFGIGCTVI
ncbi:F-box protein: endocytic membrane traffic, recycling ReCYcling 1 [Ophidiomyces ophidiicola]|nr:F-box protein: endocytic membrane traffic, recycling ReCYcling 1 [Ophidiomyces ophidiicola]KAI1979361.1 F-box protein: endocytic membrane traffic, recycling ReCYcling 1 [Ophidiomyces ophidiicola]KAI1986273.1 F-box protein: endocytic membrane traffic, recycling ReCYcling 1 [Ophidiomyces ophidiicola]KAI1998486.1 F-box protein: endocytic membrane traffic, recycling ReCYcling 1 [Ophidiomyces ophidiicola]